MFDFLSSLASCAFVADLFKSEEGASNSKMKPKKMSRILFPLLKRANWKWSWKLHDTKIGGLIMSSKKSVFSHPFYSSLSVWLIFYTFFVMFCVELLMLKFHIMEVCICQIAPSVWGENYKQERERERRERC